MSNLASTYRNQGRLQEAEELVTQALKIQERILGMKHPDTLRSMNNLASTYWDQGRWKEAGELEIQVLEKRRRRFLGTQHPETLTSMNNLAWTMKDQGRKQEAISLMTDCVQLSTTKLDADHPDTKERTETLDNHPGYWLLRIIHFDLVFNVCLRPSKPSRASNKSPPGHNVDSTDDQLHSKGRLTLRDVDA
ncbi:MAG: hypothetical protein Q9164_007477 [Protoblastenia rupestris]